MSTKVPIFAFLISALLANHPLVRADEPVSKLDAAWQDLGSEDEARASRALLVFADQPKASTEFLQSHLKPLKLDEKRLRSLVEHLASKNARVRTNAEADIEALGPLARRQLEAMLAEEIPVAANKWIREWLERMPPEEAEGSEPKVPRFASAGNVSVSNDNGHVRITIDGKVLDLDKLNKPAAARPRSPFARALRGLALLEHFGTPEARAIVADVADGEPEVPPTKEARAILKRWKGRAVP